MLGGVQAIAVTHKRKADAPRECAGHQGNPGKHLHPPEAASPGGSEQHGQGHSAGQENRAFQAPADAGRQGYKEINEPERGRRVRQQEENRKGRKVKQEWELPFAQARNVFHQQQRESRSQVTQHEGDGVRPARLRRFFQQDPQSQDHENWPGIGDLPLEMPVFDAVRVHVNRRELLLQTKRPRSARGEQRPFSNMLMASRM